MSEKPSEMLERMFAEHGIKTVDVTPGRTVMSETLEDAAKLIEEMGAAAERAAQVTREAYPDISEKWTLDAVRSRRIAALVRDAATEREEVERLKGLLKEARRAIADGQYPVQRAILVTRIDAELKDGT